MGKRFIRKNRKGVLHFIELNVREQRPAFRHDLFARMALLELRRRCDEHPAKLIAYVVMPTHLHLIVNPRDGNAVRFIRDYKAAVTITYDMIAETQRWQAIRAWLTNTFDGHRQLWQDGKHDFHLWGNRLIWQKIDYIHNNPISAGLVRRANEYPYSSFTARYGTPGEVIVPIDKEFWWEDDDFEDEGD
jgi:REP element-mobilizing transposase RayT